MTINFLGFPKFHLRNNEDLSLQNEILGPSEAAVAESMAG
jgi:hypothetical protein